MNFKSLNCIYSFAVLFGVLLLAMPESPVWLRSKNRFKEADKSAAWLKLTTQSSTVSARAEMEMKKINQTEECATKKSIYFTRPIMMPLLIGLTLLVLQQISGIDSIIFFTVEIFRASGNFKIGYKRGSKCW